MILHMPRYPQKHKKLKISKHFIIDGAFYFYIEISFMTIYVFFLFKVFGSVIQNNGLPGKTA